MTLNHTTLKNLALQICEAFVPVLLNVNLSSNQTLLLTFMLYVKILDDSINSGTSSVRGYLPLIRKNYVTVLISMVLQFM